MGAPAISPRPSRAPRAPRNAAATSTRPTRSSGRAGVARRGTARAAPVKPRRSRITPPGGMVMIPAAAVGRTAGAVGGIADCRAVVGMTRGRAWIVVLAFLLGGIVALNVWGLSMSASTSGAASKVDELERANSVLRARIDRRLSIDRVRRAASSVGLTAPAPKAIRYRRSGSGDVRRASARLAGGEITLLAASLAPVAEVGLQELPDELAAADPASEPVTPAPVPVEPEAAPAAAPITPAPEPAPAPDAAPAPGGVAP
jgi:hypothetical protein